MPRPIFLSVFQPSAKWLTSVAPEWAMVPPQALLSRQLPRLQSDLVGVQLLIKKLTANWSRTFRCHSPHLVAFNTTVKLPDIVSLGIRQRVDQRWTLVGTAEWTNWSRIGTLTVSQLQWVTNIDRRPATRRCLSEWQAMVGSSLGAASISWSDRLTVRAGAGLRNFPCRPIRFVRRWYPTTTECGPRLAQAWQAFQVYPRSISHIAHLGGRCIDQHNSGVRQSVFRSIRLLTSAV